MGNLENNQISQVLDNAVRLRDDSRLLHEHSRYPSSLALGILSAEEIGKALLQLWPQMEMWSGQFRPTWLNSHIHKQAAFGSLLCGIFVRKVLLDWCEKNGYAIIKEPYPGFSDQFETPKEIFSHLSQAMSENQQLALTDTYILGTLQKIKHWSLYTDFEKPPFEGLEIEEAESSSQLEQLDSVLTEISGIDFTKLIGKTEHVNILLILSITSFRGSLGKLAKFSENSARKP